MGLSSIGSKARRPQSPVERVREDIESFIKRRELGPNDRLPSERDYQDRMGVARGTVREAMLQLEALGVIFRQERRGWFVSPERLDFDITQPESFMDTVRKQNHIPRTETLDKQLIKADFETAPIFGVAVGAPLYSILRRRYIDSMPMLLERIHVSPETFPDIIDRNLDGSIRKIMREDYAQIAEDSAVEMFPTALLSYDADWLNVSRGTPCLYVRRVARNKDGQVIEFDKELWRNNAFRLTLARPGEPKISALSPT